MSGAHLAFKNGLVATIGCAGELVYLEQPRDQAILNRDEALRLAEWLTEHVPRPLRWEVRACAVTNGRFKLFVENQQVLQMDFDGEIQDFWCDESDELRERIDAEGTWGEMFAALRAAWVARRRGGGS